MKIGVFAANTKSVKQIERASQVHQLYCNLKAASMSDLLNCVLRVWNNSGQIIPPTKLRDIAVLNGDEYPLQCGFDFANGQIAVVITYEICDEGSINKTVYVELDTTGLNYNVELDAMDVTGTTAVKVRMYNLMNIVSPAQLPKNSVCIMDRSDILSLQKNNDLMGEAEILTHSNCILREGALSEVHPVVWDTANATTFNNELFTEIADSYVMGYDPNGRIIISTGNDEFILHPVATGCVVNYCQKSLTKIAQQVNQALISAGQENNVDSQEFASAVASVGAVAEKQGKSTDETQFLANKVVSILPSVQIAKLSGVKNFNLASESTPKKGLSKTL